MRPKKRSGRILRPLLWGGLGLWALALGVSYLTGTLQGAVGPGDQVLDGGTKGRTVQGQVLSLLPRDSAVAVLTVTSECVACRVGVPAYRDIAARLRSEGVALRVIVGSDSLAVRQFSQLLPEPGTVVWDPEQELFRGMGVRKVPSLHLVGRDGRLRKTWAPLTGGPGIVDSIAGEARAAR